MMTLRDETLELRLSRAELIRLKEAIEQAIVGGVGLYVPHDPRPEMYVKCIREPY